MPVGGFGGFLKVFALVGMAASSSASRAAFSAFLRVASRVVSTVVRYIYSSYIPSAALAAAASLRRSLVTV